MLAIRQLTSEQPATVRGKIVALGLKYFRKRTRSVFEFVLDDGTGRLHCRWWNLPYMKNYFSMGDEVMVFGKVGKSKPRSMDHPETEVIEAGDDASVHLDRIVPVYPLTEGLSQRWLRGLIWDVLRKFLSTVEETVAASELGDLPGNQKAVRDLHFPDTLEAPEKARQRLALEEFLELQLSLQKRRRHFESAARAVSCPGDNRLIKPFLRNLEFTLTPDQTAVLREIRGDLKRVVPMRRLLQGDVASGKTVVAACTALMALESGCSAVFMAPTEILAEQHFQTFTRWLQPLGVSVSLHTANRKIEASNQANRAELIIGTHALLQPGFTPSRIGLVVIDEQHKFGVAQREQLVRKGHYPHLLIMTATPIPRSLGLTLYADLDLSTIRNRPGGRGRLSTYIRTEAQISKIWAFLQEQVAAGKQAFIVYPRIEESEDNDLKAVTAEFEILQQKLAPCRLGLMHGKLKSHDKERVMDLFRRHQLDVLLATPVIEVGVDVPNASLMIVENAERFGLAQLHQLRGRIGRGGHDAICILLTAARTAVTRQRLGILAKSNDGFEIAEFDLQLRGPGNFLGQEQSGLPPFRFADLAGDRQLLEHARALAEKALRP